MQAAVSLLSLISNPSRHRAGNALVDLLVILLRWELTTMVGVSHDCAEAHGGKNALESGDLQHQVFLLSACWITCSSNCQWKGVRNPAHTHSILDDVIVENPLQRLMMGEVTEHICPQAMLTYGICGHIRC